MFKFNQLFSNLFQTFSNLSQKEKIGLFLPPLIGFLVFNQLAGIYYLSEKNILATLTHLSLLFNYKIIYVSKNPLIIGSLGAIIAFFYMKNKRKNAKNFKKGVEHGSARWGKHKDILPYINKEEDKNIILTATESLTMTRASHPKYERNKNVLVIGGSGSGKTRFFIKPNIMQLHSSYVITDPKGTLLPETGEMLRKSKLTYEIEEDGKKKTVRKPYLIKSLNTINFKKSMKYNPFAYIRSEKDILKFVNALIVNTSGSGEQAKEDFWIKAERLYFTALIALIYYEAPKEEQNILTLLDLIDASETSSDDENFKNAVDLLFEELEEKDPKHFAVRQYKKYKLAAGETAKSILISCGARLAPFDIAELRELMSEDELELDKLGEEPTALFVIISDTDQTFNFIVAIMYTQLFNLLCDKADDVYNGKLPIHVRFLLDEFANIGKIPNFEILITTIRSREISTAIVLQTKSQLKAVYKDNAETISGNCDTHLFLGGKEKTTLKELSEELGKETIDYSTESTSYGQSKSSSVNYNKKDRELMTESELALLDGDKCILSIRGVPHFKSKKYDILKHKRVNRLYGDGKAKLFNIQEYMNTDIPLEVDENGYIIF